MKLLSTTSRKLIDRLRLKFRTNHFSYRTEQACIPMWSIFYVHRDCHHGVWRNPRVMGKADVEHYLTWLAVEKDVALST
ncbi:phage integrase N-terminal SAM-like domain-containing protein [uncultured Rubinisphaera sp.]|uniref:phage integrase N-terminal SAM-like domain-containing protein n=1 Tax=Rubinisphaera sp. TaxID=2024857 RepID=UPI00268D8A0D